MQGKAASNEGVLRDTRAELNLKKDEMEDLKHQLSQGLVRVYGQVNALFSMLCCGNAPARLLACLLACVLAGLPNCSKCSQMQSNCTMCITSPMLGYLQRMASAVIYTVVLMRMSMLGTSGVLAYLYLQHIVIHRRPM